MLPGEGTESCSPCVEGRVVGLEEMLEQGGTSPLGLR